MVLFVIFLVIALICLVLSIVFWKQGKKNGWSYVDDTNKQQFEKMMKKYDAEMQEFKEGKRKKEPTKPMEKPSSTKDDFKFAVIAFVIFSALAIYNHPLSAEEQAQLEQQKQAEQYKQKAAEEDRAKAEKQKKNEPLLACWKVVIDTDNQLMNTVSNPMKTTLNGLSDGSLDRYAAYTQFEEQYKNATKLDSDFVGKMDVPDGMDGDDEDKIEQAMQDYSSAISCYRSAAEKLMNSANKGFNPKAIEDAKTELQGGNMYKQQAVSAFTEVAQKNGVNLPK